MLDGERVAKDPLAALRSHPHDCLRIGFIDGESVIAADITLLEEEGLVWYRLLRSNRPEKYESFDEPHLYSARISDILLSELCKEAG